MRSKTVTLKIPWRLWEAYEKHAREAGYEGASAMLIWAPFYSLMVGKPHIITAPIASLRPDAQDEIIETIVGRYERGEFTHRSLLENELADVVAKFKLPVAPEVVGTLVSAGVRRQKKL